MRLPIILRTTGILLVLFSPAMLVHRRMVAWLYGEETIRDLRRPPSPSPSPPAWFYGCPGAGKDQRLGTATAFSSQRWPMAA